MEKKTLKQRIKQNPALKKAVHRFIMHPVKTRPNWWIRLFYFVYLKRGKGSVIYRSVRKDLPPFNQFSLGCYSVVEDFCCLNNAVGDLFIGDYVWIGANSVILPGVILGKHSVVAAGSVVSRSIPAYSICAGCPAKVIKSYDFATKEWKKVK